MPDPLFDTLFRSTAPSVLSAPPKREPGTRSRAGNAMGRTRAALLDGARRAVETNGTKITMSQVAVAGGVAKATLYNHFRTREAVLEALLLDEVEHLITAHADLPLADALAGAAGTLSAHPALRALARIEPGTLAALGRIELRATGWQKAHAAVEALLGKGGRAGAETVLRWLASYLLSPAPAASIAADLAVLIAGLPDSPSAAGEQTAIARTA